MGLYDHFPYTNFHEINLMWIIEALKEIETTTEQFVAINSLKYADPIQWNITSQYEKNTIVIDPQTGTAYISVQPVPTGVSLTNEDYWTVVFDLGSFVTRAAQNFTNNWEAETTLTATFSTPAGGWLVWGDTLYKALVNITAGDSYVVGSNISHFTMEELVGHLTDLSTTDKSNLVAAINEVLNTSTLSDLTIRYNIANRNFEDDTVYPVNVANHALFWWNGQLCKTITAVSAGDPITIGTNCEYKTVEGMFVDFHNDLLTLAGDIAADTLKVRAGIAVHNFGTDTTYPNNYATSTLFWSNGTLYTTTTAVSAGDPITVGTNCQTTSIESVLSSQYNYITNSINNINDRIDKLADITNKQIIFVGDSYGESPSVGLDWESLAVTMLSNLGVTAYRCHLSGASFGGPIKYLTALQGLTVSDPDDITDIIVLGGNNDVNYYSGINSGISDFITYCNTTYPNSTVHIGVCSLNANNAGNNNTIINGIPLVYRSAIRTYGGKYITNSELMFHTYDQLGADKIHVTSDGSANIRDWIVNYILNGEVSPASYNIYDQMVAETGYTIGNLYIDEYRSIETVQIILNLVYIDFPSATDLTTKPKIATLPGNGGYCYGYKDIIIDMTVDAVVNSAETALPVQLSISNGALYISSALHDKVTRIYFQTIKHTCPISQT